MTEEYWLIKDGIINKKIIKKIQESKGEYILIFKKHSKQRTNQQNRALHLWFSQLSEALNKDGFDMRAVIREGVDIFWTPFTVKEHLWKPVQDAMLEKKSTTQLTTNEIDKIYEVVNKAIGERTGIFIEFPHIDLLIEREEDVKS